jgi:P pilus assembly chaperone PapD
MQRFLLLILFPLLGLSYQSMAQGNLLITPMRIVFEGNKQQAEINIMNTGKDTATYSISFRQYNMTEQGRLELIEKPDQAQMFADPYLRIFPRQVTLAPGEPQVIMLQYRRSANMLPGEYRSHLWFRVEPDYKALDNKKALADSNQLSVNIIPIYGITIP